MCRLLLDVVVLTLTETLASFVQDEIVLMILLLVFLLVMAVILVNLFVLKKNKKAESPQKEKTSVPEEKQ